MRWGCRKSLLRIVFGILSLLCFRVAIGWALRAGKAGSRLPSTLPGGTAEVSGVKATAGRHVAIAQQPLTLEGRPRTLRSAHPIATREAPHTGSADTRHTWVTHLTEDGVDRRFIQEAVGHRCDTSTAIYTHVSGDFMNTALRMALGPAFDDHPFQRRKES